MRFLITGGAGFIGSHLADDLLAKGHQVVILDNFDNYYARSIKESNLHQALAYNTCKLVEGDIRDSILLQQILLEHDVELIIHLAAKAGVRSSIECPEEYCDVNIKGTLTILEAMRAAKVSKLIFASSSSVYGNSSHVPFREDHLIDCPISPYASTKRAGELLCHAYCHLYGFNISCLRLFTVYGPRQRPDLAIHKFIKYIDHGKAIPYYGDGGTSRDYTYISDIIEGIQAAARSVNGFNIFNLGGFGPVSLQSLVDKIAACLQKEPVYDWLPMQPGDMPITYGCITRASFELNYRPLIDIDEGLQLFVEWYRQGHIQPAPIASIQPT